MTDTSQIDWVEEATEDLYFKGVKLVWDREFHDCYEDPMATDHIQVLECRVCGALFDRFGDNRD